MSLIEITAPQRDRYAGRITETWQTGVVAIIETSRLLIEAKASLPHGEWEAMIERDLPFGPRTARMLMQIARNPQIANRNNCSVLPANWTTLHALSKLPRPRSSSASPMARSIPDLSAKTFERGT
jgi:Protein of unknown function (DUF3102)